VEELRVNRLSLVEPLESLQIVHVLTVGQLLLLIDLLVVGAHIVHYCDLRRNLTLGRPALGQECANMRLVAVRVEVGSVFDTVDEEGTRVMEVMKVGETSSLRL